MRSNQTTRRLLLFVFFISLLQLSAEPKNLVVEDLTFTRPENWRWAEPTPHSPAVNRFVVPDATGAEKVDVRFYIIKKDYTSERDVLRVQFPESKPNDLHEQRIKIGKQSIIYFQITGTYVYHDRAPKLDRELLGAAIPFGKQFVYARMEGQRSEVDAAIASFKKMVETAVSEREEDSALQ